MPRTATKKRIKKPISYVPEKVPILRKAQPIEIAERAPELRTFFEEKEFSYEPESIKISREAQKILFEKKRRLPPEAMIAQNIFHSIKRMPEIDSKVIRAIEVQIYREQMKLLDPKAAKKAVRFAVGKAWGKPFRERRAAKKAIKKRHADFARAAPEAIALYKQSQKKMPRKAREEIMKKIGAIIDAQRIPEIEFLRGMLAEYKLRNKEFEHYSDFVDGYSRAIERAQWKKAKALTENYFKFAKRTAPKRKQLRETRIFLTQKLDPEIFKKKLKEYKDLCAAYETILKRRRAAA